MFFKSLIISIILIFSHLLFFIFPYKTISIFLKIIIFSIFIYPLYSSFFKFKNKKNNFKLNIKTGFVLSTILTFSGIFLLIPFSILLNLNFKFLAYFVAAISMTIWIFFTTKFAFIPFFNTKNIFEKIILSFKLTKKNYCTLFAITLKTILKLFFILPMPWAIKQYATKTFLIFKTTKFGGDDGI